MAAAFDEQNEFGRTAEQRVADVMMQAGCFVSRKFAGARHDLAVIMPSASTELLEVKNEDRYADGENVCLEIGQHGEPSGVLKSEATIGIHTFGKRCLVYRMQPLRLWLETCIKEHGFPIRNFGDNGNCGVIVPRKLFMTKPWAELTEVSRLPSSKVFRR